MTNAETRAGRGAEKVGRRMATRPTTILLLVAVLVVAAVVPARASFRGDPSFGRDGKVLANFPGGDRGAEAVAVDADGSVVVGGETNGGDFALLRLLSDGTQDLSFGAGGFATTDFFGAGDRIQDLALQPDGRIVAAGSATQGAETGFGLVRYLPSGSPDPSFGTGGAVYTDPSPGRFIGDDADAVVVQPDGKIVVAGGSGEDFAVARYLSDGTLDPGFGAGGVALLDFGGHDGAKDVVLQPDGRIVVGGQGARDLALARFLPDGSLDPTFGTGGVMRTDISGAVDTATALGLQPDGKLVLAGVADGRFVVARYLPDGGLDPTFATGGILADGGSELPRDLAILPDGSIVVVGGGRGGITEFCFLLVEISSAGVSGDLSGSCFGDGTSAAPTALDVTPGGHIVVAGGLSSTLPGGAGRQVAVVRYVPNAPPVADAGGPYEIGEGGTITLDGTGSSDADGDPLLYRWDLDDDGAFDSEEPTATLDAPRDDAALDVCLRVSDGVASDPDCTRVVVTNVRPHMAIDPSAPATIDEGEVATVRAAFSDPGSLDTYVADVDWGDSDVGTTPATITMSADGPPGDDTGDTVASVRFGDDGDFVVRARVRDDDGGAGIDETLLTVRNVAPTATVELVDGTSMAGGEALIAAAGEEVAVTGHSTDPGSDDLTLSWDFGDGSPIATLVAPADPTAEDPPNLMDPTPSPTVGPRDVSDVRSHTFGDSCLYEISLTASDDDAGESSGSAAVLVTGSAIVRQSAGWWYSQFAGTARPPLATETLVCYVGIARFASAVFDESVTLSTLADARAVLQPDGDAPAHLELFDRELLAAYLNFGNGSIGFDRPVVDTDGDHVPDTTFGDAVANAEAARLDPASSASDITRHRLFLSQFNRVAGGA